jgi:hypothetical protein
VRAATKAARIFFMDGGVTTSNIEEKLRDGAIISRVDQKTADAARKLTKRQMPW